MAALRSLRPKIFQPVYCQVRHRKSLDVRKPPPPSLLHRIIKEVTAPVEVYRPLPMFDTCATAKFIEYSTNKKLNRYEEFLLKEVRRKLESKQLLMVYHYLPINSLEKRDMLYSLSVEGFTLFHANSSLMKLALADTRWANLSQLVSSYSCYITSENLNISDLLKVTRDMPKLILMGGAVQNHILTRDDIVACSKLSLEDEQSQLVSLLSANSAATSSLLNHHQRQLVASLDQLTKTQSQDSS
ncbi:39S ribosomal protein L10, mitochondrial-like [Argonauta hians]